jgi:glycosyltransferase involved in cell wall biosynthesis
MEINLSIIILAGNEEKNIAACLKTCSFAKEIILVAANSTDKTKTIAKDTFNKIKIIETNDEYNKHFSKWRNLGYKLAKGKWILYIDADERITSTLKNEIQEVINQKEYSYYAIPRANYFLGKRVRHGGTYPDYVKRLFNRKFFKGYTGILHEEAQTTGQIGYLKNDLLHYTHTNLFSMIQKTIAWTDMEAKALHESNHPKIVWWRIFRMMLTKLWQRLIIESMWKDGTVGFISSLYETFDTFIIYARLWELQQNDKKSGNL